MAKKIPAEFDPSGFQLFWAKYPRREAKIDAYKAWRQLQPDPELQASIHAALEWQISANQWADQPLYCPLPASYLRAERWTDERRNTDRRAGADRRVSAPAVGRRRLVPDHEPL